MFKSRFYDYLTFCISRRTSDGHLEEIDHKETRTGKSEGLFANENDDFDKVQPR